MKKPISFLDLPGEIRNQIYSLLIDSVDRRPISISACPTMSSVPWLTDHPLSNVHPQISREWASVLVTSTVFEINEYRAKDATDSRRIWVGNLEEYEAMWVRKLQFTFRHLDQTLHVYVDLDATRVHDLNITLHQPPDRVGFPSICETREKLQAAYESMSSERLEQLNLTRKELLSRIFLEVFQFQIWVQPGYLTLLKQKTEDGTLR